MSIFWFAANRRFKLNVDDRVVPTTRSQIIRLLPSHQLSGFLFCSHASIPRLGKNRQTFGASAVQTWREAAAAA
jgi:hypothetical protein